MTKVGPLKYHLNFCIFWEQIWWLFTWRWNFCWELKFNFLPLLEQCGQSRHYYVLRSETPDPILSFYGSNFCSPTNYTVSSNVEMALDAKESLLAKTTRYTYFEVIFKILTPRLRGTGLDLTGYLNRNKSSRRLPSFRCLGWLKVDGKQTAKPAPAQQV